MKYIEEILDFFIKSESSDLHLSVDKIPMIRLNGEMVYVDYSLLDEFKYDKTKIEIRKLNEMDINCFVEEYQSFKLDEFEDLKHRKIYSIDSSLSYKERRLRLHLYCSSSGIVVIFRMLQEKIPTIESLYLPTETNYLSSFNKGLVLVTGATGSGKSTTLAAVLDKINKEQHKAIVTVENPIEYIHTECNCRVEQREVGLHVESFSSATRDMMREDPDIILVGEMRDIETIKNTITLSETGHLVFATLHTKSVSDSIDRIIDVFPAEQQQQIRVQLSYILLAVLNQTLMKGIDGMIPLCELLIMNSVTSSMIRQGKTNTVLRDYMRSAKNGSLHLIDNVAWHIKNNRLTLSMCKDFLSASDYDVLVRILESTPVFENKKGVVFNGTRRF